MFLFYSCKTIPFFRSGFKTANDKTAQKQSDEITKQWKLKLGFWIQRPLLLIKAFSSPLTLHVMSAFGFKSLKANVLKKYMTSIQIVFNTSGHSLTRAISWSFSTRLTQWLMMPRLLPRKKLTSNLAFYRITKKTG